MDDILSKIKQNNNGEDEDGNLANYIKDSIQNDQKKSKRYNPQKKLTFPHSSTNLDVSAEESPGEKSLIFLRWTL